MNLRAELPAIKHSVLIQLHPLLLHRGTQQTIRCRANDSSSLHLQTNSWACTDRKRNSKTNNHLHKQPCFSPTAQRTDWDRRAAAGWIVKSVMSWTWLELPHPVLYLVFIGSGEQRGSGLLYWIQWGGQPLQNECRWVHYVSFSISKLRNVALFNEGATLLDRRAGTATHVTSLPNMPTVL